MQTHIALLRAVNVGGTGKLAMEDLRAVCAGLGFADVSTYIQSGNAIFRAVGDEAEIAEALDKALGEKLGKRPGVFIRTPAELKAVVSGNPFAAQAPNRVLVSFFADPLPDTAMHGISAPDGEEAVVRGREIYVHYPLGSGRSKFKLPVLKDGTSRNMNTVAKLAELGSAL